MTEHTDIVERQKIVLEAEKWAAGITDIHVHSLGSMWYDNRPQDTANGESVTDIRYNSGVIVRSKGKKVIHTFGEKLTGSRLVDAYLTNSA